MSLLDAMAQAGREADSWRDDGVSLSAAEDIVRAALEEARKRGFVLVPVEPTPAMINAACETEGCKVCNNALVIAGAHGHVFPNSCIEDPPLHQEWRAMISASPSIDEV